MAACRYAGSPECMHPAPPTPAAGAYAFSHHRLAFGGGTRELLRAIATAPPPCEPADVRLVVVAVNKECMPWDADYRDAVADLRAVFPWGIVTAVFIGTADRLMRARLGVVLASF